MAALPLDVIELIFARLPINQRWKLSRLGRETRKRFLSRPNWRLLESYSSVVLWQKKCLGWAPRAHLRAVRQFFRLQGTHGLPFLPLVEPEYRTFTGRRVYPMSYSYKFLGAYLDGASKTRNFEAIGFSLETLYLRYLPSKRDKALIAHALRAAGAIHYLDFPQVYEHVVRCPHCFRRAV